VPSNISSAENSASADIRARAIRADGPALHGVQRSIVDAARERQRRFAAQIRGYGVKSCFFVARKPGRDGSPRVNGIIAGLP
jgi:hypothetical protein